jgi:hypothetical protein
MSLPNLMLSLSKHAERDGSRLIRFRSRAMPPPEICFAALTNFGLPARGGGDMSPCAGDLWKQVK